MELSQLKYFQAVAAYQTVTRAAEILNLTQSTVSKAVLALEEELGTPLFVRGNRRMTLTKEGRAFLLHVQNALNELDGGVQELRENTPMEEHEIRLRVLSPEFLLGIIETYVQSHPDIRLTQNYKSPDPETALLKDELTFCISSRPFSDSSIAWEPLLTEFIYLLVSRSHPRAGAKAVQLSWFAEENFITFNSNPDLLEATQRFCRLAGFTPHIAYEAGETPDLLRLVDLNMGVAFVSSCIRLRRYHDDEKYREDLSPYRYLRILYPQCTRTIGLAFVKGRYLSPAAREFRAFVEEYFADMARQIQKWFPE